MESTVADHCLLVGGHVYSPSDPFATAMLIIDREIVWIGSDVGAMTHADAVDDIVNLEGSLVTPAFVDAHVHSTATGVGLQGLDLVEARSPHDLLQRLGDACRRLPASATVWGHGWDDSEWVDPIPERAVIDQVAGGRAVYLSRIDVHSALISAALVSVCPGIEELDGFTWEGPVSRAAHLRARTQAVGAISDDQRRSAQRAMLSEAASHGIASVHEMAGPGISSAEDLRSLLELANQPDVAEVIGYWGALHGIEEARALGAHGCAGDLFVDGSLGSRTACLRDPYHDEPGTIGTCYLDAGDIAGHVVACTQAGVQAGFHVIGDAAMDVVIEGLVRAEATVGAPSLRRARHRLEHAEMLDRHHLDVMARLGITASMQSAFDARWGGPHGMYAQRLGATRGATLNPLAEVIAAGVPLALGSDSPVTPLRPWDSVRAAVHHHIPDYRISARAAFSAHTRGGRRAAGQIQAEPGVLVEGSPATFAIWAPTDLHVQAPRETVAAWSTDPRSGTPGLPDLTPGTPAPDCRLTVRGGTVLYDRGDLEGLRR